MVTRLQDTKYKSNGQLTKPFGFKKLQYKSGFGCKGGYIILEIHVGSRGRLSTCKNQDKTTGGMVSRCNRYGFALQKVWFYRPKGMVLQPHLAPIANPLNMSRLQRYKPWTANHHISLQKTI